jgi:hypothetical protein
MCDWATLTFAFGEVSGLKVKSRNSEVSLSGFKLQLHDSVTVLLELSERLTQLPHLKNRNNNRVVGRIK